jgi:hypothetical protein
MKVSVGGYPEFLPMVRLRAPPRGGRTPTKPAKAGIFLMGLEGPIMNVICVASVLFVLVILASLILVGVRSASPVKHDNPGIRTRQEAKAAPSKPGSARVPQPGVYDSPGIVRGRYEKGEAETFFCLTVFFGMIALLACTEAKVYFDVCWGLIQQVIDGLAMAGGLGMVVAVRPGGPLYERLVDVIIGSQKVAVSTNDVKCHDTETYGLLWILYYMEELYWSQDGVSFEKIPPRMMRTRRIWVQTPIAHIELDVVETLGYVTLSLNGWPVGHGLSVQGALDSKMCIAFRRWTGLF